MAGESHADPSDRLGSQRIDKWLWAARFFRTRALAAAAVSGGKVHVDGRRVKPACRVRPGDRLDITRGMTPFAVVVRGVCDQRRPAQEAQGLYEETEASLALRARLREAAERPGSGGRPDRRDRREARRLREKR